MCFAPSFDNEGFLVVNGTHGLAPAVILAAAKRNAQVVFSSRPGDERAVYELLAAAGSAGVADRVSAIPIDLASDESVEQLVDAALERLPSLDVLVHNLEAAAVQEYKPVLETSLAEWNNTLASELRVPFMMARKAIEEYLFSGVNGRIVFIGYCGRGPGPASASYAAAQSGLRALVRCAMKEFGRREIACNAVIVHQADLARSSGGMAVSPAYDLSHPAPGTCGLVETVLFLSSHAAGFVNGEFLDISGAWRELTLSEMRGRPHAQG